MSETPNNERQRGVALCGAERPTLSLSLASHDTKSTSRYRHYTQRTTLYFSLCTERLQSGDPRARPHAGVHRSHITWELMSRGGG